MNWTALIKPIRSGANALVKGIADAAGWLNPFQLFQQRPASKQLSFTIAFVGLAAKMAKADGVAVEVETQAFESCFYVPPEERANVQRVYRLAAQDVAGYELYAERIARMLADDPALLKDVFDCLFNIAAADASCTKEKKRSAQCRRDVRLRRQLLLRVRSLFVHDPTSPYVVFGIEPDASDEELRTRRLATRPREPPRQEARRERCPRRVPRPRRPQARGNQRRPTI